MGTIVRAQEWKNYSLFCLFCHNLLVVTASFLFILKDILVPTVRQHSVRVLLYRLIKELYYCHSQ